MGDRAIPEGNPILVEKERKRLRQVHLSRLRKTRPTIDTSLPKGFSKKKGGGLIRKKNLKREQQMEERHSAIERENRRLLEKMSSVMTSKTLDNKLAAKYRHFNTVNGPARKKWQEKIKLDNEHNKKLINNTQAFYQTKVWEVEREAMEKQIIYFCTITAGRKGRIIAPLIKRGKTRRRSRKGKRKKKKRPITAAATSHRNNKSLLEPLGRTYGRPNTTGPLGGGGRKSKTHGHLHANSFTKEELELKLKEVEKRYEKWQDASNATPLQGETLVEIRNDSEHHTQTVSVVPAVPIDEPAPQPCTNDRELEEEASVGVDKSKVEEVAIEASKGSSDTDGQSASINVDDTVPAKASDSEKVAETPERGFVKEEAPIEEGKDMDQTKVIDTIEDLGQTETIDTIEKVDQTEAVDTEKND